MKNILVPTDFSACAKNATEAGLALAEFYNANLFMYSVVDLPEQMKVVSKPHLDKEKELQQMVTNTNILFKEISKEAKRRNIPFHSICETGDFNKNIQQYISEKDIDLVVMGSHGASGKNEWFIGSNTQNVVRKVHTPVLVIKEPLKDYSFQEVVFASNFDDVEMEAYKWFLDFIRPFQPKTIHLLSINTTSWFSQPFALMKAAMQDFKDVTDFADCKLHFYKDSSVDAGIRHFIKKINADLVAISNRRHRPMDRILNGSNVEMLVNHSDLPVLSIDFPTPLKDYSETEKSESIFKAMMK